MKGLVRKVLVVGMVLAIPAAAMALPTLPDTGVDIVDHVTVVGTVLGAAVLAIVGLYFAYLIVWRGVKWVRRALT